jgi:hypothetical protein
MKKTGIVLLAISILMVFITIKLDAFSVDESNIWGLNVKQNMIFLSGIILLAGVCIFGFGYVAENFRLVVAST